ncbi:MAG: hypothetical protein U1D35_04450, partial [Paracoccaceae bacterium]|nr:hypothetical protein [Paracoccaceae bacterium]
GRVQTHLATGGGRFRCACCARMCVISNVRGAPRRSIPAMPGHGIVTGQRLREDWFAVLRAYNPAAWIIFLNGSREFAWLFCENPAFMQLID